MIKGEGALTAPLHGWLRGIVQIAPIPGFGGGAEETSDQKNQADNVGPHHCATNLPNSRLRLVADKADYKPGDTAQVFIPNPFGVDVQALLTIERSLVMEHQVVTIGAQGYNLSLPLTGEHAPNVYLSATLIGRSSTGLPDFRQGFLNLPACLGLLPSLRMDVVSSAA